MGGKEEKKSLINIKKGAKMSMIEGVGSLPAKLKKLFSPGTKPVEKPFLTPRSFLEEYQRFFCNRCQTEYLVAPEDLEIKPCPYCDFHYWLGPIPAEEIERILFGDTFKETNHDHHASKAGL